MKELIISKELISEVLGLNVAYTEICEHRNNIIGIWTDMNTKPIKEINLYEFVHLNLKQWAFKQGYELFSRILSNDHQHIGNCVVYRVEADPEESLKIMNEKTEIEAIIKACNWILEQNK